MKFCFSFIVVFLCIVFANGQSTSLKYSRVKVDLQERTLSELALLGLETDHGTVRPGQYIVNEYSELELSLLRSNGFAYKTLIEDVSKYYVDQNLNASSRGADVNCDASKFLFDTPQNYTYGSMGGYHTYGELLSVLDQMNDKFPALISKRQAIDSFLTEENRPLYWVKIGDQPRQNEGEPKILYTALHHAREPAGLSQMIFYMWYLLENYNKDPEVKFLVDSTSLYFIPCVNPDGYVYNEVNNPNGGGLWRKNRSVVGGDTVGVDLNRNYGFEWAYDDIGSSSNPNSSTYRGEKGFSEPETQAIRAFTEKHKFDVALNYHSYGNLLIYPWGFSDGPTPEDHTFKGIAEAMTVTNNYLAGTASETVGYTVNGTSDDHMYGEHGTFAFTPEIGNPFSGFWPPRDRIDFLNKSVLDQNLIVAKLVHTYVDVQLLETVDNQLRFELKKYSLDTDEIRVSLKSLTEGIKLESPNQLITVDHLQTIIYEAAFTVNGDPEAIPEARIVMSLEYPSYTESDTFTIPISSTQFETVLEDDAEDMTEWSSDVWGNSTERSFEGTTSLTDSPFNTYEASSNSILTTSESIDLSEVVSATLQYHASWGIEEDFDYAQVRISTDGEAFYPLCGLYTENGTAFQDNGQPIYDGKQDEWVREMISLDDYIGEEVWIQFALISDEIEHQDGFYLDDIEVVVKRELSSSTDHILLENDEFVIVPNPFTQDFSVLLDNQDVNDYNIFDYLGRKVSKSEMIPGVYFVEVMVGGKRKTIIKAIKVK
jgi:hypothetical protein